MSMLDDAIQAIRMGDKEEGRRLLEEMLETDEGNEDVWLWLTTVVDSDEDREVCLENVLAINPSNTIAQRNINALKAGNFNPADIARSAIVEEEEEEAPATGATFWMNFAGPAKRMRLRKTTNWSCPAPWPNPRQKENLPNKRRKRKGAALNSTLASLFWPYLSC
ncbi:MAG: hypothetical protein HC875_25275 [Anaerolineales bacterium]|nr:hypothetical protein [Anaerolineales bacterium]